MVIRQAKSVRRDDKRRNCWSTCFPYVWNCQSPAESPKITGWCIMYFFHLWMLWCWRNLILLNLPRKEQTSILYMLALVLLWDSKLNFLMFPSSFFQGVGRSWVLPPWAWEVWKELWLAWYCIFAKSCVIKKRNPHIFLNNWHICVLFIWHTQIWSFMGRFLNIYKEWHDGCMVRAFWWSVERWEVDTLIESQSKSVRADGLCMIVPTRLIFWFPEIYMQIATMNNDWEKT